MRLKNSAFRMHQEDNVFMCSGDGLECFENTTSPALVFFHPPWYVGVRYALRLYQSLRRLKRQQITVVICCNQKKEVSLLRLMGLRTDLFNQNLHLAEKLYHPIGNVKNQYDAIYTAQARPFKRMYLACEVSRLYVLTYGCKSNSEGENDLRSVEPSLTKASYNKGFIHDKEEISKLYAAASCGLALSRKEGAMWASMEYLMAGLPVVTTKNVGGRDHYFNSSYVKEVAANSEAVRAGVEYFVKNPPNRDDIRREVLEMVMADRKSFLQFVGDVANDHGMSVGDYDYIWGGDQGLLERHEFIIVD